MGLRERKKERIRAQLLKVALNLFERRGFEETTIEQLASVVEVSPRTLLRYFKTKEDIVVAWVDDVFASLIQALEQRPAHEDPLTALRHGFAEALGRYEERRDFFLAIERVIGSAPAIRARKLERIDELVGKMSSVLARRMGVDPKRALMPRLLAGSFMTIAGAAIDTWVARNGKDSLNGLLDEALRVFHFSSASVVRAGRRAEPSRRQQPARVESAIGRRARG